MSTPLLIINSIILAKSASRTFKSQQPAAAWITENESFFKLKAKNKPKNNKLC